MLVDLLRQVVRDIVFIENLKNVITSQLVGLLVSVELLDSLVDLLIRYAQIFFILSLRIFLIQD